MRKPAGATGANNNEKANKKPLGIDFGAKFGMLKKVAGVTVEAKPIPQ